MLGLVFGMRLMLLKSIEILSVSNGKSVRVRSRSTVLLVTPNTVHTSGGRPVGPKTMTSVPSGEMCAAAAAL